MKTWQEVEKEQAAVWSKYMEQVPDLTWCRESDKWIRTPDGERWGYSVPALQLDGDYTLQELKVLVAMMTELAELEKQIDKVKANQLPIETAKTAEVESRPMSELLLMLENRVYDL